MSNQDNIPPDKLAGYRIEFLLENYKTLREEILESISSQNKIIMSEGIAVAVGIIIGFGVAKEPSGVKAFIMIVPFIIIALTSLWTIEQSRMMRAGDFMQLLEDRINLEIGGPYTVWENWLRKKDVKRLDVHKVHHLFQYLRLDVHKVHHISQYLCILGAFFVIGISITCFLFRNPTFFNVSPNIVRYLAIFYFIMFAVLTLLLLVVVTHRGSVTDKERFREWLDGYWEGVGG